MPKVRNTSSLEKFEVISENRRETPRGDLEKYLAQWADRDIML